MKARFRRPLFFPVFLLCFLLFPSLPAQADTGPKPSVQVEFTESAGETYYATLLSRESSTGPQSAYDPDYPESAQYPEGQKDIWQAFVDYEDPDGFYFLQWFWECTQTNLLDWNYFPPQEFKILVFYPETGEYRASGVYERYAFDSTFTVDLSQPGELQAVQGYDYQGELVSLVLRAAITILLELGIALLFGYRTGRQLLLLAAANLITQLLLNLALARLFFTPLPLSAWYVLLELFIFCGEALLYSCLLQKLGPCTRKPHPVLYALTANAASFLGGLGLAEIIPQIF